MTATRNLFIDFNPEVYSAMRDLHPPYNEEEWRVAGIIKNYSIKQGTLCACKKPLSGRVVVLQHKGTRVKLLIGISCCLLGT